MNTNTIFFIGVGLSLSVSLTIVFYLRKSLRGVLVDLCESEQHADYWMKTVNVTFVLVPLFFSMFYEPNGRDSLAFEISRQFGWALFGLIGTILVISRILNVSIDRYVRQEKRNNQSSKSARS